MVTTNVGAYDGDKSRRLPPVSRILLLSVFICTGPILVFLSGSSQTTTPQALISAELEHHPTIATNAVEHVPQRWFNFVHFGAAYLMRVMHSDGRFDYEVAPPEGPKPNPKKYNVLRHAGACYSLTRYHHFLQVYSPSESDLREKVKRSARLGLSYLKSNFIHPIKHKDGVLAVWDEPKLIGQRSFRSLRVAKLGGAGLALTALVDFEQLEDGFTPLKELQQIAEFIIYMQMPDGSFASKYTDEEGKLTKWVSLYYPGEAALGLSVLFERDRDIRWLRGALKTLLFLAKSREGKMRVESDHWAMLATEKVVANREYLSQEEYSDEIHELIMVHMIQVVNEMERIQWRKRLVNDELYVNDRKTTPLATRVEGFVAIVDLAKEQSGLVYRTVVETALRGVKFLVSSQILANEIRHGGVPRSAQVDDEQYDNKDGYVRIDYNQHAMCGVMGVIQKGFPSRHL